jgi:small neutral amino acid transporter SnatA (MarC family)
VNKENNRKTELENQVKNASQAIEGQFDIYKNQGKSVLVIGGIIVAAYAITQLFDDTEKESSTKKETSMIGGAITGLATTLALNFAKEKLMAYLEKTSENAA